MDDFTVKLGGLTTGNNTFSFDIKDSIKLEELVLLSDLELHSRILPLKELTRSLQSA